MPVAVAPGIAIGRRDELADTPAGTPACGGSARQSTAKYRRTRQPFPSWVVAAAPKSTAPTAGSFSNPSRFLSRFLSWGTPLGTQISIRIRFLRTAGPQPLLPARWLVLAPLFGDFVEASAIAAEDGWPACIRLPSPDDHVGIQ